MSAALQTSGLWASASIPFNFEICAMAETALVGEALSAAAEVADPVPEINLAFYRKHTEKTLRRYLYASMLVGRAPAILGEPIARGWVSSRRMKTFEDAVIFVLDVERCLDKLGEVDKTLLSRIALQEYTQEETADLMHVSVRTISYKYPVALDRLTELLLASGLLILPCS